jgi:hypothetical protein
MSKLFELASVPPTGTPSSNTGATSVDTRSSEMGKEDIVDFLAEDEDDKETIDLGEKEPKGKPSIDEIGEKESGETSEETGEEEGEEEDELKELEDELEGPTDEQLELITPVRRRDILKKYPNLFKDFPYLEKAYYREQQFTELLPTIEDAKTAVEKANVLDRFENDVIQGGSIETILKAVREENPRSFSKIADEYLPTLAKVDERAYYHVLSNVVKHTIVSMVQESTRSQNEPLKYAAQILNQFVFGSSDFSPPTQLFQESPEDKAQENQVKQREQQFIKQAFTTTVTDLNTRVNNALRNTIDAHIDPKKGMTEYVRNNASRDALDLLNELVSKDARFRALTDKLWEKAINENFSKESVDRIKSAYLSKSKTLLPSVIKKARNDALRGMGKRARDEDETSTESTSRKGPISAGRPRSPSSTGKIRDAKDIPKGMSTLDFLNSD